MNRDEHIYNDISQVVQAHPCPLRGDMSAYTGGRGAREAFLPRFLPCLNQTEGTNSYFVGVSSIGNKKVK